MRKNKNKKYWEKADKDPFLTIWKKKNLDTWEAFMYANKYVIFKIKKSPLSKTKTRYDIIIESYEDETSKPYSIHREYSGFKTKAEARKKLDWMIFKSHPQDKIIVKKRSPLEVWSYFPKPTWSSPFK